MKTSATVMTLILAGNIVLAQTPALTETKPAEAAAPAATEAPMAAEPPSAPPAADKSEQVAAAAPQKVAESGGDVSSSSESSIEYVGADIQDVLRTLARQAGLNIVLAEDVQGKITISLTDVSYEKAIKLIADSKGYVVTKEENVLKVQTKASVAAEPLQEDIVTLEYTTAAEVEKVIRPFLTAGRGNVTVDPRSNTLVISDVPARLTQIREIVKRVDTQTPQVMIEARIIETVKNPKQDYGIKWESLLNYEIAAKNIGWKLNPSDLELNTYKGGSPSLPIKQADVAVLTASDFKVLISFLNSNGEADLLASPRVVTADNKEARINIAQQYPIPQFTFNQQTASLEVSGFEFKDIGILLGVIPHINKSGFITMEVKPEISTFDPNRTVSFGGAVQAAIPIINTRNMHASIMIKDGHTLALGGLIQETDLSSITKVPLMGDIPGLGAAFRSKSFEKTKRNLLIFVTPTIVGPSGSTGFEDQYSGVKNAPEDDFANPNGWRDNAFSKAEQKKRAEAISANK
jgi:type IV pilus assembly protein PilQ